jgi:DNA-binding transcriptional MerR regulator
MTFATPPAEPGYRIGDAALRSGVTAANIRYYEKEGLIAPLPRGDNSYRLYGDADVHRLRFIRLCRAMDMSLDEVRTLLALDLRSKADCDAACVALDNHLGHVRERLRELRSLEKDLIALRDCCDGTDAQCHIIETLHARADHQPLAKPQRAPRTARHV